MPELPEVEYYKKYFESTSIGKTVEEVTVRSSQILEDITKNELKTKLTSKEFLSAQRYGKYLFVNVSGEFWLALHFGMTGNLQYFKDPDEEPLYDRLRVIFDDGYHLAFDCQRKFGRVAIAPKVTDFVEKKQLGMDALQVGWDKFKGTMQKRRGRVKPTLMNQHVVAGIGNLYSDEIIFQTGVHPETKICEFDDQKLEDLFSSMKRVLKMAVRKQADYSQFPKTYLLTDRLEGAKCPLCGGEIQTLKISGRTAYFCSKHQKQT